MVDTPGVFQVQQALSCWHAQRSRLLTEDNDLAGDEQQLAALLGTATEDLGEIEHRLAKAIITADRMADVADAMAADILSRRNRYRRRSQSYRSTLLAIFEAVGKSGAEYPDATISVRRSSPGVVVTDQKALIERFWREEKKRTVNKAAILEALKDGEVVDGAVATNGPLGLIVRSR